MAFLILNTVKNLTISRQLIGAQHGLLGHIEYNLKDLLVIPQQNYKS